MRAHKPSPVRRRSAGLVLVGLVCGVLVTPALAWAAAQFNDVPPTHPAYRAITAVADAGLMTGDANGNFNPGRAVTRSTLAQILHRGLQRVSVDETVTDIPVAQPNPTTIAETNMGIDGVEPGVQGVLLTLDMQVEATRPLANDCTVELLATSFPQNLDAGTWTFTMYTGGHRSTTVNATFVAGQLAGTLYTYQVTADSSCGRPLNVIQGAWTAQSAAFTGNGSPFVE